MMVARTVSLSSLFAFVAHSSKGKGSNKEKTKNMNTEKVKLLSCTQQKLKP